MLWSRVEGGNIARKMITNCGGEGKERGRPNKRWLDDIREDTKEYDMTEVMAENLSMWHMMNINADPLLVLHRGGI